MTTIRSFFEHYAERYMAADVDAIATMYEAPFLAVRDGNAIHLPDDAAVQEHLAELMEAYGKAGAVRADIASLDTLPLGPSGEMVRDFYTSYHLLRNGATWRILSYTNHA